MLRPFVSHVTMGQPVQFVVNQGHQLIEGRLVPVAPGNEQLRDFVWRRNHDALAHLGRENDREARMISFAPTGKKDRTRFSQGSAATP